MKMPAAKYKVGDRLRNRNGGGVLVVRRVWLEVPDPDDECQTCGQKLPASMPEWCYGFDAGYLTEGYCVPADEAVGVL